MSGTYPPYGYGGRRPTHSGEPGYGEAPGYGEDPWYGGGGGYEEDAVAATGSRQSSQGQYGYGRQGYGQYGYDQSGYGASGYGQSDEPAHAGYAATVPAQDYPTHEADPYGQGSGYPEPPPNRSSSRYEGFQGYSERQDHWNGQQHRNGRRAGTLAPPPGGADTDRFGTAAPPPEPAPARRRGRGVMIALAVIAVVLALAGVGGQLVARPVLTQWPATLSKPEKLAGLELSTEPALRQAADEIAADIRKDVKVDEAIAAFYHDPANPDRIVALVGGTAFLASPKAELSEAFRSAQAEGMSMGKAVPVNAGPLGGLARYAAAEQKGDGDTKVPLSVCAWADHGSLLIGLFFHRPVDESAALLRTIRGEMLKR